jgi:hypothetical protein
VSVQTQISRFTDRCVWLANRVADDQDDPAALEGGGGFADNAMISLNPFRMYLSKRCKGQWMRWTATGLEAILILSAVSL